MTRRNDPQYLLNEQYRDASNLNARGALHAEFSTNQYGWHRWAFDQLDLPDNARILELGSGPGWLWQENADRIPAGWQITLSDFSPGMLMESQHNLNDIDRPFNWEQIDAQAIPYPEATFDAVIANHMLYHVPDRAGALAEIARVLKPSGTLYAATNGAGHLREITDLMRRFVALADHVPTPQNRITRGGEFDLENGAAQLGAHFTSVDLRKYADGLLVTDIEPLVAYVLSAVDADQRTDDVINALRTFLAAEMQKTGVIDITKDTGLFVAQA